MCEHLMSYNGDESELLTDCYIKSFSNSVQKLPSISRSSKHLSANGHFSLGSLVMYSSFSLPLSISLPNIILATPLFVKDFLASENAKTGTKIRACPSLFYSSSPSSSSTTAATVDEIVDATVITTTIQIKTINAINVNKNPVLVIPISPLLLITCITFIHVNGAFNTRHATRICILPHIISSCIST